MLPNKLGELLSSMYLIGVALSLRMPKSTLLIKMYGWLIFKANFSLGIELPTLMINLGWPSTIAGLESLDWTAGLDSCMYRIGGRCLHIDTMFEVS